MNFIAPGLIYIILISTLTVCKSLSNQFNNVNLQILYPKNNSVSGPYIDVHFQLDFYDDKELIINPSHIEFILEVFVNGFHKATMNNFQPWHSVAFGPIEGEDAVSIDFFMSIVDRNPLFQTQEFKTSANVVLNVFPDSFSHMSTRGFSSSTDNLALFEIISSLIHKHSALATTVALSLDDEDVNHESIIRFSPQIIDFFDWSTPAKVPKLHFSNLFSAWQTVNISSINYRAYYDVSIVVFTSCDHLIHDPLKSDEINLQNIERVCAIVQFLYTMRAKTSGNLILVTTKKFLQELVDVSLVLFETEVSFLSKDFEAEYIYGDDRVVRSYGHSVEARVRSSTVKIKDMAESFPTVEGTTLKESSGTISSTVTYKEIQNGLNYCIIQNGCFREEGKLVLLIDTVEEHLVANMSLRQFNAFLNSNSFMPFTEVYQANIINEAAVLFVNDTAALIKPYYDFNIFHHFQSLAGVLSIQDVFPEALRYLVLPTYDSTANNQYEWSNGVLSLVTQFYEKQSNKQTSDDVMSLIFKPQFESLLASSGAEFVCFKELVVVGQADAARGFFTNRSVLNKFRETAYQMYAPFDLPAYPTKPNNNEVTVDSAGQTGIKNNNDEKLFHAKNSYLLKVTFSLRMHNRRIVNLPALHSALIQSGVVDMDWLNHLYKQFPPLNGSSSSSSSSLRDGEVLFSMSSGWTYLDTLNFQDQIRIFRETDLFIGVHGSAFINAALFMQPNSVCIALMQSRHIEFILPQIIHQAELVFHFLPVINQNQSSNCDKFSEHCLTGSLLNAGGMNCLGIRNCDVEVNVVWFQALVEQSANHVRANKRVEGWKK